MLLACRMAHHSNISGAPYHARTYLTVRSQQGSVHIRYAGAQCAAVTRHTCTACAYTVQEFMDAGKLVPDRVVVDMVKSRLAQPDVQVRQIRLAWYTA